MKRTGGEYDVMMYRLTFRCLRWSMRFTNPLMKLQDALLFGQPSVWVLHLDQTIKITGTRSNLGKGNRPWFECPKCSRRCQVLWCSDAWRFAACGKCAGVKYVTRNLGIKSYREYMEKVHADAQKVYGRIVRPQNSPKNVDLCGRGLRDQTPSSESEARNDNEVGSSKQFGHAAHLHRGA